MPTYKQLPHKKNPKKIAAAAPWYTIPENWVTLGAPVAMLILLLAAGIGIFKFYRSFVANKASTLVSAPQISPADLEAVVKKYPKSDAASVARVKLGKKALDAGQWQEAIRWYEPVSTNKSAAAVLRVTALHNMALASLKEDKNSEKALSLLDQARKDAGNEDVDYTDLLSAHVRELSGEKEKAVAIYKSLAEGAKDPVIKQEAQERLKWVDSKS
jgi:hypothetical protein